MKFSFRAGLKTPKVKTTGEEDFAYEHRNVNNKNGLHTLNNIKFSPLCGPLGPRLGLKGAEA